MFKFNKDKIETPVEEQVIEPKRKLQVHEKIIVGVVLTLILGMAGAALASNLGPSNSLDDMAIVYQRMQDEIESMDTLRASKVETCQLHEVSMAKRKMELYFGNQMVLTDKKRQELLDKSEGKGLRCGIKTKQEDSF